MCIIDGKYFDNYGKIYFVLDSTLNFRDYCFFLLKVGQITLICINMLSQKAIQNNAGI